MKRSFSPYKLGGLIVVGAYFLYCIILPGHWHFIDGVDLLVHEAGHVVFMPFGEFMSFLGGTLLQILVPIVFSCYFYIRKDLYSGSIILMWVGQNLGNISIYIKDAVLMQLPLLGGGMHDWNYLLGEIGALQSATGIGTGVHVIGFLCVLGGITGGIIGCFVSGTKHSVNKDGMGL